MCKGEAPFLASEIKFDTLFYPILLRIGEVSLVNDDNLDNRFYEKMDRFSQIEEDELPFRLLVSDYA